MSERNFYFEMEGVCCKRILDYMPQYLLNFLGSIVNLVGGVGGGYMITTWTWKENKIFFKKISNLMMNKILIWAMEIMGMKTKNHGLDWLFTSR